MDLVITVPHSVCPTYGNKNHHPCDTDALKFARLLSSALSNKTNSLTFIRASKPRLFSDMNRRVSRGVLSERAAIDAALSNNPNPFLIDVHSYDDGASWGRGIDLAVFDVDPVQYRSVLVVAYLKEILGVPEVGFVVGSPRNDIIVRAKESGVPCLMVEVREDLPGCRLGELAANLGTALVYVMHI